LKDRLYAADRDLHLKVEKMMLLVVCRRLISDIIGAGI